MKLSNHFEHNDTVIFHPGYYIEEIVKSTGLFQNKFAKRLDITSEDLGLLMSGNLSVSTDIAAKLAGLTGFSVNY